MRQFIMGVYKIHSKKNGKIYIGSSIDIQIRRRNHFNSLRGGRHTNKKLQNHFNKYGEDDLLFEVITTTNDLKEMLEIEQKLINEFDAFKTGFNMSPNAGNSLGRKHSVETKQKLSQMQIGKTLSEEHKRNIGISGKGRVVAEETRQKISNGLRHKPKSESARKNMSNSAKNRKPITEETRQKLSIISKERTRTSEWVRKIAESNETKIGQYDTEHNLLQEWNSIKIAAQSTGIARTGISNVLNGRAKTAGGFFWKYM